MYVNGKIEEGWQTGTGEFSHKSAVPSASFLPDEVEEITGHPVAGAANASIKITPEELKQITDGLWVDVCEDVLRDPSP